MLPPQRRYEQWSDLPGHPAGQVVGCVQRADDPALCAVATWRAEQWVAVELGGSWAVGTR